MGPNRGAAPGAGGRRALAGLRLQGGRAQRANRKMRGFAKASGHPGAAGSAILLKIPKEAHPGIRVTPWVEEVGETDKLSSLSGIRTQECLAF